MPLTALEELVKSSVDEIIIKGDEHKQHAFYKDTSHMIRAVAAEIDAKIYDVTGADIPEAVLKSPEFKVKLEASLPTLLPENIQQDILNDANNNKLGRISKYQKGLENEWKNLGNELAALCQDPSRTGTTVGTGNFGTGFIHEGAEQEFNVQDVGQYKTWEKRVLKITTEGVVPKTIDRPNTRPSAMDVQKWFEKAPTEHQPPHKSKLTTRLEGQLAKDEPKTESIYEQLQPRKQRQRQWTQDQAKRTPKEKADDKKSQPKDPNEWRK